MNEKYIVDLDDGRKRNVLKEQLEELESKYHGDIESYKYDHGDHTPEEQARAIVSMIEMYFTDKKEEREITSSTYVKAQKRLKKDVESWLGL